MIAKNAFSRKIEDFLKEESAVLGARELFEGFYELETDTDVHSGPKRIAFALSCLEKVLVGEMSLRDLERLYSDALKQMNELGIARGESKAARYIADLDFQMAKIYYWHGSHSSSFRYLMQALDQALELNKENRLLAAKIALRNGDAKLSLKYFSDSKLTPASVVGKLKALWLLGSPEFLGLATEHESHHEIKWLKNFDAYLNSKDWFQLLSPIKKGRELSRPIYAIRGFLIVNTSRQKAGQQLIRRPRNVLRALDEAEKTRYSRFALAAAKIDELERSTTSLDQRIKAIGLVTEIAKSQLAIEDELLLNISLAASLVRVGLVSEARLLLQEYRGLSLKVSDGHSSDILGLSEYVESELSLNSSLSSSRVGVETRHAGLRKLFDFGKISSQIGVGLLQNRLKRLFAGAERARRLEAEAKMLIETMITSQFSRNTGVFGKVAQLGALLESDLPYNLRERFEQNFYDAPKMSFDEVKTVVEKRLGGSLDSYFSVFHREPVGAGKVAQVHEATTLDGQHVAVKIKYPGVEKSISSDFKLIARMSWLFKFFFPGMDCLAIVKKWEKMTLEECDFRKEIDHRDLLAEAVSQHANIVVPKIHRELSTEGIIVMDYVDGISFNSFLDSASQKERDEAGVLIYQAIHEFLASGFFKYDFHPGNYLFLEDNRIAILDFGGMRRLGEGFDSNFWDYLCGAHREDRDYCEAYHVEHGWIKDRSDYDSEANWDLVQKLYLKPLMTKEEFKFDRRFVKAVFDHTVKIDPNLSTGRSSLPSTQAYVVMYYWSLYSVLGLLGSKANFRQIFSDVLDNRLKALRAV